MVWDFFIERGVSGLILSGDGRGHADPLGQDVPLDKSRVMFVLDMETGPGQVLQTETCTARPRKCNEPRPIVFDGSAIVNDTGNDITGEGINLDTASQYWVDSTGRRVSIRYDALNSITPVGVSVDGRVGLEVGPDGRLRMVHDDRDDYPSQGIYQYRPGGDTVVVHRFDEEHVFCGALPINIC